MAKGKRQLFAGEHTPATLAFALAAAAEPNNPLPFAYRSWAGRLADKSRAISDAKKAVALDASCAEAHMSLALAYATGEPDFEAASMALYEGRKCEPRDADGAVLCIGVYLLFVDAIASMREDADGFIYDFQSTPLRDAADHLLSGHHADAFEAFGQLHQSGRTGPGGLGMTAACWAAGNRPHASTFAMSVDVGGAVTDAALLAAVRTIFRAADQ